MQEEIWAPNKVESNLNATEITKSTPAMIALSFSSSKHPREFEIYTLYATATWNPFTLPVLWLIRQWVAIVFFCHLRWRGVRANRKRSDAVNIRQHRKVMFGDLVTPPYTGTPCFTTHRFVTQLVQQKDKNIAPISGWQHSYIWLGLNDNLLQTNLEWMYAKNTKHLNTSTNFRNDFETENFVSPYFQHVQWGWIDYPIFLVAKDLILNNAQNVPLIIYLCLRPVKWVTL